MDVPPRESTGRGHPARRREFRRLGYERWRDEKGHGRRWLTESIFSAVRRGSGEAVRETSFADQALEAVLKFRAYSWMCLVNLVVGRAPGVEVEGWTVNSGKTGLPYFQVSHLGWKN